MTLFSLLFIWTLVISIKVYAKLHKMTAGKVLLAMFVLFITILVIMLILGLFIGFLVAMTTSIA